MNKITELNKALPMVASVLGKKYGVQVEIGGKTACTDGKVIRLPTLPLEPNDILVNKVRGWLDHESAHIRETDFEVLLGKDITPLIKNIWNIFEDWRVENAIAKCFPGCRTNLNWLIEHEFTKPIEAPENPAMQLLNYLLLSVRAWDVEAVKKNRDIAGEFVMQSYPDLLGKFNHLLEEVKMKCRSSKDAWDFAREAAGLIEAESQKTENEQQKENTNKKSKQSENRKKTRNKSDDIQKLLNADKDILPCGLGERIAGELESAIPKNQSHGVSVAMESKKYFEALGDSDISKAKRASSALHARLHSLLQSKTLSRQIGGTRGKLDAGKLYRMEYSARIFLRHGERQGINTAVHILLDCSRSMHNKIELASQACYAIANSLNKINGISVGVTVFPASPVLNKESPTVCPALRHGEKLHRKFRLNPSGSTPMGEALWWVMQQCYSLKENRKIILIITDGKADSVENTENAITHGKRLGFEFYGIGIDDINIMNILPDSSKVITKLDELTSTIFKLLQDAILK